MHPQLKIYPHNGVMRVKIPTKVKEAAFQEGILGAVIILPEALNLTRLVNQQCNLAGRGFFLERHLCEIGFL